MSDFEESQIHPVNIVDSSSEKSIIGKVKSRVSNTLSKWFSAPKHIVESFNGLKNDSEGRRVNRRRHIELSAYYNEDADDHEGATANYNNVILADDIAEHDLSDCSQTCMDYKVNYRRTQHFTQNRDENLDRGLEHENEKTGINIASEKVSMKRKINTDDVSNCIGGIIRRPPPKQKCLQYNISERDIPLKQICRPLHCSTPSIDRNLKTISTRRQATGLPVMRNFSNRHSIFLNLYRHQKKREPPFFLSNSAKQAVFGNGKDSAASNLNMPSCKHVSLPNLKRRALSTAKRSDIAANGLCGMFPLHSSTAICETGKQCSNDFGSVVKMKDNCEIASVHIENKDELNPNNGKSYLDGSIFALDTECDLGNEFNVVNSQIDALNLQNVTNVYDTDKVNNQTAYKSRTSLFGNNRYNFLGQKSLHTAEQQLQKPNFGNTISNLKVFKSSSLSLTSLNRRQFNASIYGSTSALSDSRLLNTHSPFYKGRTTYGGASAYSNYNVPGTNAAGDSYVRMIPTIIRPTPRSPVLSSSSKSVSLIGDANRICSLGTDSEVPSISKTTKNILLFLNEFSTPSSEAKKMADRLREQQLIKENCFHAADLQTQRKLRFQRAPYSRPTEVLSTKYSAKTILPPIRELHVPKMAHLLKLRKIQNTTENIRNIAIDNPSMAIYTLPPLSDDKLNSVANTQKQHTNKMRQRIISPSLSTGSKPVQIEDKPPPPINLPTISFPQMNSMPKFDIKFSKSFFSSSKKFGAMQNKISTPPVKNVIYKTAEFSKIDQPETNNLDFIFCLPIYISLENVQTQPNITNLKYNFCSPVRIETNSVISNFISIKQTGSQLKPGSVLHTLQPDIMSTKSSINGSLNTKFEQLDDWICNSCMLRNKNNGIKCVTCETSRNTRMSFKTVISTATTSPIHTFLKTDFSNSCGDNFKQSVWECPVCMVSNKMELSKCCACEATRKYGVSTLESHIVNSFYSKPQTKCSTCFVNKTMDAECTACQAKEISLNYCDETASTAKFNFGFLPDNVNKLDTESKLNSIVPAGIRFETIAAAQKSLKWSCLACFAQNDAPRNKCICCEEPKPDANVSTNGSKFMLGQSAVNKLKFGLTVNDKKDIPQVCRSSTGVPASEYIFGDKSMSPTFTDTASSSEITSKIDEHTKLRKPIALNLTQTVVAECSSTNTTLSHNDKSTISILSTQSNTNISAQSTEIPYTSIEKFKMYPEMIFDTTPAVNMNIAVTDIPAQTAITSSTYSNPLNVDLFSNDNELPLNIKSGSLIPTSNITQSPVNLTAEESMINGTLLCDQTHTSNTFIFGQSPESVVAASSLSSSLPINTVVSTPTTNDIHNINNYNSSRITSSVTKVNTKPSISDSTAFTADVVHKTSVTIPEVPKLDISMSSGSTGNAFGNFAINSLVPVATSSFNFPSTQLISSKNSVPLFGVGDSGSNTTQICSINGNTNNVTSTPVSPIIMHQSTFRSFPSKNNLAKSIAHSPSSQAKFGGFSGRDLTPLFNHFGSNIESAANTNVSTSTKPAFDFATAAATLQSSGRPTVFNFSSNHIVETPKPAYNFTQTNPGTKFNFTGAAVIDEGVIASTSNPLRATSKPFQFNATSQPTNIYNFSAGGVPTEAITNSSTPFQFNASGTTSPNIFAINPSTNGAQNLQQARRKVRAPIRRTTTR